MRKRIGVLLASALLLILCIPCAAADTASDPLLGKERNYAGFSDVPVSAWYAPAVELCYETGVLNGTSETAFSPQSPLTCAQLEVLTARVSRRLAGETGELPAAAAGTGSVSIRLSDGTVYGSKQFVALSGRGLVDGQLPQGTYLVVLSGENIGNHSYPYLTLTLDGSKTVTAYFDARNSWDPAFYMFRFEISPAEAMRFDPMTTVGTWFGSRGASTDAWYWSSSRYLSGLAGSLSARLPEDLTANATRFDAAAVMSLIASDGLLPALGEKTPPDTDRADVLRLYQAGVFTGTDAKGTFSGKSTLTRAQFAVILSRLLSPSLRIAPS